MLFLVNLFANSSSLNLFGHIHLFSRRNLIFEKKNLVNSMVNYNIICFKMRICKLLFENSELIYPIVTEKNPAFVEAIM